MITWQLMKSTIYRLSYKPGWQFLLVDPGAQAPPYLQLKFSAIDSATGNLEQWTSRKWQLSFHMTESEIVQTAMKAVLTAEEHEAREAFRLDGLAIFGPHIDLEALKAAARQVVHREEAPHA